MDSNGVMIMFTMFAGFGAAYVLGTYNGFKRTKEKLSKEVEEIKALHKVNSDKAIENGLAADKVLRGYDEVEANKKELVKWHERLTTSFGQLKAFEAQLLVKEADLIKREKQ